MLRPARSAGVRMGESAGTTIPPRSGRGAVDRQQHHVQPGGQGVQRRRGTRTAHVQGAGGEHDDVGTEVLPGVGEGEADTRVGVYRLGDDDRDPGGTEREAQADEEGGQGTRKQHLLGGLQPPRPVELGDLDELAVGAGAPRERPGSAGGPRPPRTRCPRPRSGPGWAASIRCPRSRSRPPRKDQWCSCRRRTPPSPRQRSAGRGAVRGGRGGAARTGCGCSGARRPSRRRAPRTARQRVSWLLQWASASWSPSRGGPARKA
jgi:hypothetical protein